MCEEPVLYEGLQVRLPCGGQASQESLADEAALCPKVGTMPPTCADQPGLGNSRAPTAPGDRTDFIAFIWKHHHEQTDVCLAAARRQSPD
jgi:hypothetical protein